MATPCVTASELAWWETKMSLFSQPYSAKCGSLSLSRPPPFFSLSLKHSSALLQPAENKREDNRGGKMNQNGKGRNERMIFIILEAKVGCG